MEKSRWKGAFLNSNMAFYQMILLPNCVANTNPIHFLMFISKCLWKRTLLLFQCVQSSNTSVQSDFTLIILHKSFLFSWKLWITNRTWKNQDRSDHSGIQNGLFIKWDSCKIVRLKQTQLTSQSLYHNVSEKGHYFSSAVFNHQISVKSVFTLIVSHNSFLF